MAWSFSIMVLMVESFGSVSMWVISCSNACLVLILPFSPFSLVWFLVS